MLDLLKIRCGQFSGNLELMLGVGQNLHQKRHFLYNDSCMKIMVITTRNLIRDWVFHEYDTTAEDDCLSARIDE